MPCCYTREDNVCIFKTWYLSEPFCGSCKELISVGSLAADDILYCKSNICQLLHSDSVYFNYHYNQLLFITDPFNFA